MTTTDPAVQPSTPLEVARCFFTIAMEAAKADPLSLVAAGGVGKFQSDYFEGAQAAALVSIAESLVQLVGPEPEPPLVPIDFDNAREYEAHFLAFHGVSYGDQRPDLTTLVAHHQEMHLDPHRPRARVDHRHSS